MLSLPWSPAVWKGYILTNRLAGNIENVAQNIFKIILNGWLNWHKSVALLTAKMQE